MMRSSIGSYVYVCVCVFLCISKQESGSASAFVLMSLLNPYIHGYMYVKAFKHIYILVSIHYYTCIYRPFSRIPTLVQMLHMYIIDTDIMYIYICDRSI